MKYKVCGDNIYRTRFMRETEELMDKLTVKEFIEYLNSHAALTFNDAHGDIDGEPTRFEVYILTEANSNPIKDFIVTEDGRFFYLVSMQKKVELIDG